MNVYTTEEEQIEKIKQWVKTYGPTVLISIFIVVVASFVYHYWQGRNESFHARASTAYMELMLSQDQKPDQKNDELFVSRAENIVHNYPNTAYADMAQLFIARAAQQQNNLQKAISALEWVTQNAKTTAVKDLARVREARILISMNQNEKALQLLQHVKDPAYLGVALSLQADIFAAQNTENSQQKALQYYQQALSALPESAPIRSLLQAKLQAVQQQQQATSVQQQQQQTSSEKVA